MKVKRKNRRETTPITTQFSQHLRQVMTPDERLLWSRLRRNALGWHFRRQAPVGKCILDFYCVKAKLAVGVDGDIHAEKTLQDLEKTNWLQKQKHIRVLRVTNREVIENMEGVIFFIPGELTPSPALPRQEDHLTGEDSAGESPPISATDEPI
jgi:very-short-patch-repair endonuclease